MENCENSRVYISKSEQYIRPALDRLFKFKQQRARTSFILKCWTMKIIGHFCELRPGGVLTELVGRHCIQFVGEFLRNHRSFEILHKYKKCFLEVEDVDDLPDT